MWLWCPTVGAWSDVGGWSLDGAVSRCRCAGQPHPGQRLLCLSAGTYIHAGQRPVVAWARGTMLIVDARCTAGG